jgi:drug/metabolite transporter (DMT)-like permease
LNRPGASITAAAALLVNAFVWGVSWWPFRQLQAVGLHPLWATAFIYTLCVAIVLVSSRRAWCEVFGALWRHRPLLIIALASGTTNATFNWAVTLGDVVRVVLLFYLMPVWAVLFARVLLRERITRAATLRVAVALVGAAIVLGPDGAWLAQPPTLVDALALIGGMAFALNNVMLRREAPRTLAASRTLAMFVGGAVFAAVAAVALRGWGVPLPPPLRLEWLGLALMLGAAFLAGNVALQYGASRLSANATAVIMLTEVFFASVSAWWLGAAVPDARSMAGGALIVAAAAFAALERPTQPSNAG